MSHFVWIYLMNHPSLADNAGILRWIKLILAMYWIFRNFSIKRCIVKIGSSMYSWSCSKGNCKKENVETMPVFITVILFACNSKYCCSQLWVVLPPDLFIEYLLINMQIAGGTRFYVKEAKGSYFIYCPLDMVRR